MKGACKLEGTVEGMVEDGGVVGRGGVCGVGGVGVWRGDSCSDCQLD